MPTTRTATSSATATAAAAALVLAVGAVLAAVTVARADDIVCNVQPDRPGACANTTITCAAGPCSLACAIDSACRDATFVVPSVADVYLQCAGETSCDNLLLRTAESGDTGIGVDSNVAIIASKYGALRAPVGVPLVFGSGSAVAVLCTGRSSYACIGTTFDFSRSTSAFWQSQQSFASATSNIYAPDARLGGQWFALSCTQDPDSCMQLTVVIPADRTPVQLHNADASPFALTAYTAAGCSSAAAQWLCPDGTCVNRVGDIGTYSNECGGTVTPTTGPTDAPAEPTDAPAEPTDAPAEPTDASAEPTDVLPSEAATSAPTNVPTTGPIAQPTDSNVPTTPSSDAARLTATALIVVVVAVTLMLLAQ